jgi:hypothetical protein
MTADKKMVDDAEQKVMAEVDQIEKEFKRGLEKLNDKLTIWIEDVQTRSTARSRVVNDASGKCLGCFIWRGMFALCGEIKHHPGRFFSSHGFSFPNRKQTTRRMKT